MPRRRHIRRLRLVGARRPGARLRQRPRAAEKIACSRTLSAPTTVRTRQALAAGLVVECQVFLGPIAIGGGKPVFSLGVRVRLELLEEHRLSGGTVCLRHAVLPAEKSTI
jgi:hypothetical protein